MPKPAPVGGGAVVEFDRVGKILTAVMEEATDVLRGGRTPRGWAGI